MSVIVFCLVRVARRRRRNKRRHLDRLMNDLNTAEKFGIVGISDDEDDMSD